MLDAILMWLWCTVCVPDMRLVTGILRKLRTLDCFRLCHKQLSRNIKSAPMTIPGRIPRSTALAGNLELVAVLVLSAPSGCGDADGTTVGTTSAELFDGALRLPSKFDGQ